MFLLQRGAAIGVTVAAMMMSVEPLFEDISVEVKHITGIHFQLISELNVECSGIFLDNTDDQCGERQ